MILNYILRLSGIYKIHFKFYHGLVGFKLIRRVVNIKQIMKDTCCLRYHIRNTGPLHCKIYFIICVSEKRTVHLILMAVTEIVKIG